MNTGSHFMMVLAAAIAAGCTAPLSYNRGECDPESLYPTPECIPDAGSDAGPDAASDAGPDAGNLKTCPGGWCVPAPSSDGAGFWSAVPISVRFGAAGDPSLDKCPEDAVPVQEFRLFAELDAPPAVCDACTCGPSVGVCPGLPAGLPVSITINDAVCNQAGTTTLPFDGPAGWDGSCTSANALPAGEKCPAGSSTLCAQSVRVSPLPGPTNEACSPTSATPAYAAEQPKWKVEALACKAVHEATTCGASRYCVVDPGPNWYHCVHQLGEQATCPGNYSFARFVMYPEEAIDDGRGCGECQCGSPEGSGCLGTMRLYDDAACSSEFTKQSVGSYGEQCGNVIQPGRAIGAKAITDLSYVAGSCGAAGGAATGAAHEDKGQAVTFCCMKPLYLIE